MSWKYLNRFVRATSSGLIAAVHISMSKCGNQVGSEARVANKKLRQRVLAMERFKLDAYHIKMISRPKNQPQKPRQAAGPGMG